jgi:hypothetical protein
MIAQLFTKGDLVISTLDPEPRIYRVKGRPLWRDGDWTYRFEPTGQGGDETDRPIRQQFLLKVDVNGNLVQ